MKCYYSHLVHWELTNCFERIEKLEKELKELRFPWFRFFFKRIIKKLLKLP